MDIEKDDEMDVDGGVGVGACDAYADLHERRRLAALEDAATMRAAAMTLPPSAFGAPNAMQAQVEEPYGMKVLRSMVQAGMSEPEARAKLATMRIPIDK